MDISLWLQLYNFCVVQIRSPCLSPETTTGEEIAKTEVFCYGGSDLRRTEHWFIVKDLTRIRRLDQDKDVLIKYLLKIVEPLLASIIYLIVCVILTCGKIVIFDLRSWSPMSDIRTPSIVMSPPALSINRNSDSVMDDFPAPVRPTIPIYKQRVNR